MDSILNSGQAPNVFEDHKIYKLSGGDYNIESMSELEPMNLPSTSR